MVIVTAQYPAPFALHQQPFRVPIIGDFENYFPGAEIPPMLSVHLYSRLGLLAILVGDSTPLSAHFWRNDSANLALTAAWNKYYAATPLSWDVTSTNISDTSPISLKWTLGIDSPLGWKDGHGCLFASRYFVIAGGVFTHVWKGPGGVGIDAEANLRTTTVYDTHIDTWNSIKMPDMPYTPLRTTGACGDDAMFILSGEGSNAVFKGGEASRQVDMLRLLSGSATPRFV